MNYELAKQSYLHPYNNLGIILIINHNKLEII